MDKIFKGTFNIVDGKLNFNCKTKNMSFDEVKSGLLLLRSEIERQIKEEKKCPYHSQN